MSSRGVRYTSGTGTGQAQARGSRPEEDIRMSLPRTAPRSAPTERACPKAPPGLIHMAPSGRGRIAAAALTALAACTAALAAPKPADGPAIARRALAGDAAAGAELESAVEPLFDRKDLLGLDEASGAREAARLLGLPESSVRWFVPGGGGGLRVLTVDLGAASSAAAGSGYVAYGIVEAGSGSAKASWYHDAGRKLTEQGGVAWHPVGVRALAGGGGGASALAVGEAAQPGADARGVLVLEQKGGEWAATRRLAPAGEARLIGVGPAGAVFLAGRQP